MMLAGGINTSTSPLVYMVFCKIGALSRGSSVRPFDRSADGTLLGEGQGIVVLKRLEDALRDSDHIYAVIKGTGAASDGRAMGLMAPRLEGEVLAMQRAYANSGIDPATIDLVEAHGTGIPLGDQLEMQALTTVLGERRGLLPRVAFGSVKSMIGHCIPAAGMASIIKMAMALDQKILPPTLADEINPALGLERTPLFLNTETTALAASARCAAPRRNQRVRLRRHQYAHDPGGGAGHRRRSRRGLRTAAARAPPSFSYWPGTPARRWSMARATSPNARSLRTTPCVNSPSKPMPS